MGVIKLGNVHGRSDRGKERRWLNWRSRTARIELIETSTHLHGAASEIADLIHKIVFSERHSREWKLRLQPAHVC